MILGKLKQTFEMVDRRRNGADYVWDILLILGTVSHSHFIKRQETKQKKAVLTQIKIRLEQLGS